MRSVLSIALLIFLSFCFGNILASNHRTISSCRSLNVILDWHINPDHAPLVIAIKKGFFTEQNLCVHLLVPKTTHDNVRLLLNRKADIALSYQIQSQIQISNGYPFTIIGTLIPTPLNIILTLKRDNIKTIADLKGKTIGYSDSNETQRDILKAILKHNKMKSSSIKLKDIEFNMKDALINREVDAVINAYRNYQPFQLKLAGYKTNNFKVEDNGIPNYSQIIFIIKNNTLNKKTIEKFLEAIKIASIYIDQHPKKTWGIFSHYQENLNNKLNYLAWKATIPLFSKEPKTLHKKKYIIMNNFLLAHHFIKNKIKPESYLFDSI